MLNTFILICLIFGIIAWGLYVNFKDSEREYFKLYKEFIDVKNENAKLVDRLSYLQDYKDDVTKTFKILDNELVMINDQIKKQNNRIENPTQYHGITDSLTQTTQNMVTMLTPDILHTLFENINQESPIDRVELRPTSEQAHVENEAPDTQHTNGIAENEEKIGSLESVDNEYDKYLLR